MLSSRLFPWLIFQETGFSSRTLLLGADIRQNMDEIYRCFRPHVSARRYCVFIGGVNFGKRLRQRLSSIFGETEQGFGLVIYFK